MIFQSDMYLNHGGHGGTEPQPKRVEMQMYADEAKCQPRMDANEHGDSIVFYHLCLFAVPSCFRVFRSFASPPTLRYVMFHEIYG